MLTINFNQGNSSTAGNFSKRKTWLVLAACCITGVTQAQNNAKLHHLVTQSIIARDGFRLVLSGNDTTRFLVIPKDAAVKGVVVLEKGSPVIDVWRILPHAIKQNRDEFGTVINRYSDTLNSATPLKGYTLSLSDGRRIVGQPTKVLTVPFRAWTWGISTTPFRYRIAKDSSASTLSANLSVSASYGYSWGETVFTSRLTRHLANTVSGFVGLSGADLKQSTVRDPKLWKIQANKFLLTDRTNVAFSYGISYTRSINNVGLVVSLGLDTAIGPYSDRWSYQNQPWIGLGINTGLGFFK